MCPCYNRRTHNPVVKKSGAQNITACENQGKATRNDWSLKIKKQKKNKKQNGFLKKIEGDNTKKTKRLTEIEVLTKRFTKRVFKKKRK